MNSRWIKLSLFFLLMLVIVVCFFGCKKDDMETKYSDTSSYAENNMEESVNPISESVVIIDGEVYQVYTDNNMQETVESTSVVVIEDAEQFFQEHPEAATLTGGQ